jgi:hypothetical protein
MTPRSASDIDTVMQDDKAVNQAFVTAYRRTVLRHRHLGLPLVVWQDGRVVEVSADDIELPPEPAVVGARSDGAQ